MKRILIAAAVIALLGGGPLAPPAASQFKEAVSVEYVMVPFSAFGWRSRPITNLKDRDVKLYVDGVRVKTDLFVRSSNAPVSFTILVDGSGSMALAGKMEAAQTAIASLLVRGLPGDDFSLYVFSDEEAREVVPFTQDRDAIRRALKSIKPYGKTAFFDALARMPDRSRLGKNPTRAIILVSDGIDNASHMTKEQISGMLQDVAVPIYPFSVKKVYKLRRRRNKPPPETDQDLGLLRDVARLTGGNVSVGDNAKDLMKAIDQMDKSLRAQYLVGFPPTGQGAIKYRRIKLELGRHTSLVRVRAGYRGSEPPAVPTPSRKKRSERKGSE